MSQQGQQGKLKQGAINIVIITIFGCLVLSYAIYASIYKFTHGNEDSLFQILKSPSNVFSYIKGDEDLKMIAIFIPIILICLALYKLRTNLVNDKYSDASEFGLHGTSDWGNPDVLRNGEALAKNNESKFKKSPIKAKLWIILIMFSFGKQSDLKYNLNELKNGYVLGKVPNSKKLLIMHDNTSITNQHVAVIGSSGSAKTQSYVLPNLVNVRNKSIIVTDPKGELHELTSQLKRDQGYKVYQVDFVHFMQSKYNPLTYVETPLQAQKVANTIISNFEGEGGDNAFFKNSATNILAGLIIYVKAEYPPEQANMKQVINIYTNYVQNEKTFDKWIHTVEDEHPAKPMLNPILDLTSDTRGSVTSTLNNGLSIFRLPQVQSMTKNSDFHYRDFIDEKSVLYVKLSMEDNTFSPLTSVFFSQMIDIYYDIAKERSDNKLKRKIVFLLDEFANIGKIDKFSRVLATCRSLGLSIHTILQNKSQIEKDNMYGKDEANDILSNHDTKLILRAQRDDVETTQWISDTLGQTTKKHNKTSLTYSKHDTTKQVSPEYIERELMTPAEIGSLEENEAILSISGFDPMIVHKAYQSEIYQDLLSKKQGEEFVANYNNIRGSLGFTEPIKEEVEYDIEQEITFSEYREKVKKKKQKAKEEEKEQSNKELVEKIFTESNLTEEEINELSTQKEEETANQEYQEQYNNADDIAKDISNQVSSGEQILNSINLDL